jgi:hypothetical protein
MQTFRRQLLTRPDSQVDAGVHNPGDLIVAPAFAGVEAGRPRSVAAAFTTQTEET